MTGNNFIYDSENLYYKIRLYRWRWFWNFYSNKKVEKLVNFLISNDVKPVGLGARDTLGLEAGLCLYGHELNEKINPVEANLKWAIAKKGKRTVVSMAGAK